MIDKTHMEIASWMLGLASDVFSNHGCNEFTLENTSENIRFVKSMIAHSDFTDCSPNLSSDGKKIHMLDTDVMDYCQNILMTFAEGLI